MFEQKNSSAIKRMIILTALMAGILIFTAVNNSHKKQTEVLESSALESEPEMQDLSRPAEPMQADERNRQPFAPWPKTPRPAENEASHPESQALYPEESAQYEVAIETQEELREGSQEEAQEELQEESMETTEALQEDPQTASQEGTQEPSQEETAREPSQEASQATAQEPSQEAPHVHQWMELSEVVHHNAVYETIHHDAVTQEVWVVDEVLEEGYWETHEFCGECGADLGRSLDDIYAHEEATGHVSYYTDQVFVSTGTVEKGHYETRTITEAYDEQVLVMEAYDEIVVVGHQCALCGAYEP
ncbi:MAG: hypothetical protein J6P72_03065 [Firmicutes bacterium]|nr:hypothetical protein [Bacillota bacterium]